MSVSLREKRREEEKEGEDERQRPRQGDDRKKKEKKDKNKRSRSRGRSRSRKVRCTIAAPALIVSPVTHRHTICWTITHCMHLPLTHFTHGLFSSCLP
jgi:hypothetical protein